MSEDTKSFWSTLPGIITAITGLITATVGAIVGLHQVGLIGSSTTDSQRVSPEQSAVISGASSRDLQELDKEDLKRRQDDLERKLESIKQQQPVRTGEQSRTNISQASATFPSVAGVWENDEGDIYTITQSGNRLTFQETNPLYGVTAVGEGLIQERQVTLSITTALGTTGTLQLRLADGGNALSGQYNDITTGVAVPVTLTR